MHSHSIKIWAHRGASGYAPENTLEAFALAVRQKADGVELDVHQCAGGELVVAHDERVDRVSDGSGLIRSKTLSELKALRFNRTHPEYADARIPTLREVYELLLPTGLTVNVELKTGPGAYEGMEQQLLTLSAQMGMEDRVLYSSFYFPSLQRLRQLDSRAKIALLYGAERTDALDWAARMKANALHPEHPLVRVPAFMAAAKALHCAVNPWTVDRDEDLRTMARLSVHAVITNYPDRAAALLRP